MAEVGCIAVIGAGTMGRGIAHVAALGGYRTVLEDLLPNALRKAESEIRANLEKSVELKKCSAEDAKSALGRLQYAATPVGAVRHLAWVCPRPEGQAGAARWCWRHPRGAALPSGAAPRPKPFRRS